MPFPVCFSCGVTYVRGRATQRFCSAACRNLDYRQRQQTAALRDLLPCESCGVAFAPIRDTQRFCTDVCRVRAHRQAKQDLRTILDELL